MATSKQNKDFWLSLCGHSYPLDKAISWISSNLTPEDVFTSEDLENVAIDWAYDNGYVKKDND
jgi:hypothetical protein